MRIRFESNANRSIRRPRSASKRGSRLLERLIGTIPVTINCVNQIASRKPLVSRDLRDARWVKRRGGDSNPRYGHPHTGFRNQHLQPLGHLSKSF